MIISPEGITNIAIAMTYNSSLSRRSFILQMIASAIVINSSTSSEFTNNEVAGRLDLAGKMNNFMVSEYGLKLPKGLYSHFDPNASRMRPALFASYADNIATIPEFNNSSAQVYDTYELLDNVKQNLNLRGYKTHVYQPYFSQNRDYVDRYTLKFSPTAFCYGQAHESFHHDRRERNIEYPFTRSEEAGCEVFAIASTTAFAQKNPNLIDPTCVAYQAQLTSNVYEQVDTYINEIKKSPSISKELWEVWNNDYHNIISRMDPSIRQRLDYALLEDGTALLLRLKPYAEPYFFFQKKLQNECSGNLRLFVERFQEYQNAYDFSEAVNM